MAQVGGHLSSAVQDTEFKSQYCQRGKHAKFQEG
jgi:hypothetical protein